MTQIDPRLTTGLAGLDRMLKGLIPGDNLVWQIDAVADYQAFVEPYCQAAGKVGEPLIYVRFASHAPLVPPEAGAEVCELDPRAGFEAFVTGIHRTIERTGRGGYYVFDCLSGLAEAWRSDQMLGNFFMLTCPYLYDAAAIAYFGLRRGRHSFHATGAVAETTQVLVDVYRHDEKLYVHPWKVQSRHSPTMHMLHAWERGRFRPVTDSATIAEVRHSLPWLQSETHQVGIWNRTFARAVELGLAQQQGDGVAEEAGDCFERLLRMCVSREERIIQLAQKYMTLDDVVEIGKRMVGTGLIGGKSVGMLLARAILRRADAKWAGLLEPHDSFFVGSDVFYTYLVRNGIWAMRERRGGPAGYLKGAERARQRMLIGSFPEGISRQFEDMLDYFGQSPIIVRSSSLLEDNFGNAFAGKYESVFCANQGSRHQRLEDFLAAVRTIYASTMSEKALTYRAQRGLLDRDEQMALLVQRVSGRMYGNLFFPQIAGVGFSFNPYVWSEEIDPQAGMVRLVFGMGTRAVDRTDDDYTRVVALNAPTRRPEANLDEARQYAQRKVDVLDLTANQLVSSRLRTVVAQSSDLPLDLLASEDAEMERRAAERGVKDAFAYVLTFDGLFRRTPFVGDLREMLATLHEAYDWPVDVEFTTNFSDGAYKINLVQCRPLQIKGGGKIVDPPAGLGAGDIVLVAHGAVIGQGQISRIDRILYVVPSVYARLQIRDRHAVARLIGRLCHLPPADRGETIMLVGPGRWGTTTPSLGVPVRFADIETVSVICEVVAMGDNIVPDVSLGTHFFSEMIETEMLYFALFPSRGQNALNGELLESAPNRLGELLGDEARWADAVRVIDADRVRDGCQATLNANPLKQRVVCYLSAIA